MAATLIVIEENGFPVELSESEIDRAVVSRRLRADMIVQVCPPGKAATFCLARDVPLLQPLFGIAPASAPSPSAAACRRNSAEQHPSSRKPAPRQPPAEPARSILTLRRGENMVVPSIDVVEMHLKILPIANDKTEIEIDTSAFLLGADGRVRGDADFVFYNNDGQGGAVVRQGMCSHHMLDSADLFTVELSRMDPGVRRICFTASVYDGEARGQAFGSDWLATIAIGASRETIARYDFDEPEDAVTGLILGELYRRDDGWKFRAVGQGFIGGLAALATSFGVEISDPS